jgi:hypothetical protein
MKSSESAYHEPVPFVRRVSLAHIDEFQRLVRGIQRQHLLAMATLELSLMDQSILAGDRQVMSWARQRWNCVWDELDRRDRVQPQRVEVAA